METGHHYAFGPFRVESTHGGLWQGDQAIALRPQSLALLCSPAGMPEANPPVTAHRPLRRAVGKRLGRPPEALGQSRLDGKEPARQTVLGLQVLLASIATITEVDRSTLDL